jgi:hypothetical protein
MEFEDNKEEPNSGTDDEQQQVPPGCYAVLQLPKVQPRLGKLHASSLLLVMWGQPSDKGYPGKENPSLTPTCFNCQLTERETAHPPNYRDCRHAKEKTWKRSPRECPRL